MGTLGEVRSDPHLFEALFAHHTVENIEPLKDNVSHRSMSQKSKPESVLSAASLRGSPAAKFSMATQSSPWQHVAKYRSSL